MQDLGVLMCVIWRPVLIASVINICSVQEFFYKSTWICCMFSFKWIYVKAELYFTLFCSNISQYWPLSKQNRLMIPLELYFRSSLSTITLVSPINPWFLFLHLWDRYPFYSMSFETIIFHSCLQDYKIITYLHSLCLQVTKFQTHEKEKIVSILTVLAPSITVVNTHFWTSTKVWKYICFFPNFCKSLLLANIEH